MDKCRQHQTTLYKARRSYSYCECERASGYREAHTKIGIRIEQGETRKNSKVQENGNLYENTYTCIKRNAGIVCIHSYFMRTKNDRVVYCYSALSAILTRTDRVAENGR